MAGKKSLMYKIKSLKIKKEGLAKEIRKVEPRKVIEKPSEKGEGIVSKLKSIKEKFKKRQDGYYYQPHLKGRVFRTKQN